MTQLGFGFAADITSLVVTWDFGGSAQACAQIKGALGGTTLRAELWGLVNPISGAKTLKAAWTNSASVTMNQVAWTGVDQTGGTTSFPNSTSATANSSAISLAITSATNDATMDSMTSAGSPSAPTQTQTYLDTAPALHSGGGSRAAGAASVTHAWTNTPALWVTAGTSIKAGGAAVATAVVAIDSNRPFPYKPGSGGTLGRGF